LPGASTMTLTPAIHAPAHILVDGRPAIAGGAIPFDGVAPVRISWDTVPGARMYSVRVRGGTVGLPATIQTDQTSVAIPADVFVKGGFYEFRVGAIQSSVDYAAGHLLDLEPPVWIARVTTGLLRLSSDCGNGVKDPGEECDPGPNGSTAACDADCSLPVCGDGFFNAAAGEQCDEGDQGSTRCDTSTCKLPACGDGGVDGGDEECDDGNVTSGDGCSATCTLERCGDKAVEAPEGCDDGNRVNGDGCSSTCQIES